MTTYDHDFNDNLDALFGTPSTTPRTPVVPPSSYTPIENRIATGFVEACGKCRNGTFYSFSGRPLGPCFACKGKGKKVFKNDRTTRERNRSNAAARKERNKATNWTDFETAHPAEAKWLTETAPRWDLAQSLKNAVLEWGLLTEKQMNVVTNGIARDAARTAQRTANVANAPTVDVTKLVETFARARSNAAADGEGIKWLRLRLDTFIFSDAPANDRFPPAIFVKEGETKLGRITGGKFIKSFACDDATAARVVKAAQDPATAATAFGQRTGTCSCCGRELTNEESRARSVGPICWERWFGG